MKVRIIQIAWLVSVIVILYFVYQIVYFEIFKTCGNCHPPIRPDPNANESPIVQPIVIKGLSNLSISYSTNNGSLPPPNHVENIVTITTDGTGFIEGKYTGRDYTQTINETKLTVSRNQLEKLITELDKINPSTDTNGLFGCTGGSSASIKVTQNNTSLLNASAYNCAGKTTKQSLNDFIQAAETIVPSR